MSNFYLPTDLLIEVLLKLPVKSLIRFTSVCKSLQSLITSPNFISSHLSITENHHILSSPTFISSRTEYDDIYRGDKRRRYSLLKVTENGLDYFSELEFPFKSKFQSYGIVGSSHGLVCLWDDDRSVNRSDHVIIWNPSINRHVVLPKPVLNPEEDYIFLLGFGVADHVVRLLYYKDRSCFLTVPPVAEIFCSRIGRWRRVEAFDVRLQTSKKLRQVFLKGVVHWLADELTVDNNGYRSYRSSILTFEVGDEVFGEVMLPDELARISEWELSVFLIGESLGVIKSDHTRYGCYRSRCDVWMMNEYGVKESWTKLYIFDSGYALQNIVGFCTSDEALFVVDGNFEHQLVVHFPKINPKINLIKNLGICGPLYIDNYVESLLLLGGYCSGATEESSYY